MSKITLSFGFGGALTLAAALLAPAAHADTPHYQYVALDQIPLPAPYTSFSPSTVVDGVVYGTVFDATFTIANVAVLQSGVITIGPAGFASIANAAGIIGGSNPSAEAALFRGNTTTLVPRLPGEVSASVVALGAGGLALVSSTNSSFVSSFAYFDKGTETVIDFGLPDPVFGGFMNNAGTVAVTKEESATDHFLHGYRYDPHRQTSTLLPPFAGDPTDVEVLVQGIDQPGDVLGYSFTVASFPDPNYHERVGVWDHSGVFQPYFEETIATNTLLFNNQRQIVISNSSDGNSYLVPAPGTRLNLADITDGVPAGLTMALAVSIDDDGDITGFSADDTFSNFFPFLLVPTGHGWNPGHGKSCALPWSVAHASDKQHPHK